MEKLHLLRSYILEVLQNENKSNEFVIEHYIQGNTLTFYLHSKLSRHIEAQAFIIELGYIDKKDLFDVKVYGIKTALRNLAELKIRTEIDKQIKLRNAL